MFFSLTYKWLIFLGFFSGFVSVAAGSFGAHALKSKLELEMLGIFEVGVRYQMYHALAIVLVALIGAWISSTLMCVSGWLFFFGSVIFSGSLYALSLSGIRALGAITPIGGMILLVGWLLASISLFFKK